MKRLILLMAVALGISTTSMAGDVYTHDATVLPQAAKTTLTKNFKAGVSVVKTERSLGRVTEYEVSLSDGTEISFDRNGNWKNVEMARTSSVPRAFLPAAIIKYVTAKHPGTNVVGIEKERNGYDVDLSNGVDMKFNKAGVFLRYED